MPILKQPSLPTLHYLDLNKKGEQGILLLHGLGTTCESWGYQVPVLASAGFRILAPDMRGFGRSEYASGLTVERMAQDAVALLHHAGLNKAHVVGISMGGTVALQLASEFPDCVDKLVLVNTFARLRPRNVRHLLYFGYRILLVFTFGLKSQAEVVAMRLLPKPEQAEIRKMLIKQIGQSQPRAYRAAMLALGRFNLSSKLKDIKSETLIITGDKDTTVDPEIQKQLLAIPGSRQVVISGAGHAVIADSHERFNEVVLEFLKRELGEGDKG